ncbi:uncharacterized protein LOC116344597 [Contarinia nasturtii]|uniref:uncharacterized protein LOC116344597 n=1 Tax=Contarinia nasturtii TaxID=265458 RepID=UPI0012D44AC1|nr:uncharacterized protein LOC116344597 [Contarinia nasturtii]XP_031629055.1 uncharacterized protein LOC116344597 [Contarinia nasturtii]
MKLFFVFALCISSSFAGSIPEPQHEHTSKAVDRLHYFVVDDKNSEITKLLKEGANTIIRIINKHMPAHADQTNDDEHSTEATTETSTESLIERININALNHIGYTKLMEAVSHGEGDIVNMLLELGAKPNIQQPVSGTGALALAAQYGFEDIVENLIKHNADVNIVDNNGDDSLYLALKNGFYSIAATLVEHGANLSQYKELSKSTVLGCVAAKVDLKFRLVLAKNDIHFDDWKNGLEMAIKQGDAKTTELIINECPVDLSKIKKPYPLHLAASGGFEDVIEVLLNNGADINAEDNYGNQPLFWAAYSGRDSIAKQLLNHGAKINTRNKNGFTPLHLACHEGKTKVVEVLLENGADINATSNKGDTPIMWAAYFNHLDIVQILIKNHANVYLNNNAGTTAREFAREKGYSSIANILMDAERDS